MSNRNSDQRRRRVDGNVSMASFAHRKGGHDRAIQEFRKRKERKFSENAKQLRQYRKVMKQEGYDAGKGASRKRSYDSNNDDDANEDVVEDDTEQAPEVEDDQQPPKKKQRRPAKTNPFQKSLKKAQQKKLDQEAIQKEKERQEKQKQQKLRDRRKMTKKLGQRSKKGQPIIKNMAHNLLKKLEKQNQAS